MILDTTTLNVNYGYTFTYQQVCLLEIWLLAIKYTDTLLHHLIANCIHIQSPDLGITLPSYTLALKSISGLFYKEVNSRLAKRPLVFNGRLANHGLTSLVKEATDISRHIADNKVEHVVFQILYQKIIKTIFKGSWTLTISYIFN